MHTKIAILGATGTVGQKLIRLCNRFDICELAASNRHAGQTFGDACTWRESARMPDMISKMVLKNAEEIEAPYVLSALPATVASTIEPMLAKRGQHVISNASFFRMHKDVPLLIPEINLEQLELIENQMFGGSIVTNPNCLAIIAALALKPLFALGKIEHISIVSLQAVSGAGKRGLSAFDMVNNTIPNIEGEELKIERELQKILGPVEITVHTNRVPVLHGHTAIMHVRFAQKVRSRLKELYSDSIYKVYDDPFSPQPSFLHDTDNAIHIGRLKIGDQGKIVGLTAMGHNLVRGAAAAALANLEALLEYQGAQCALQS